MNPPSAVLSAVLQVALFSLVPFAYYAVGHRTMWGFLSWLGLYRPRWRSMAWATLFMVVTAPLPLLLYLSPAFQAVSLAQGTTGGDFSRMSSFDLIHLSGAGPGLREGRTS